MIYGVFYCLQKSEVFRNFRVVFRNCERLKPSDRLLPVYDWTRSGLDQGLLRSKSSRTCYTRRVSIRA
jgi:hypothetical protein